MSWELLAAEAAKSVTAGVGGVVVAGAGKVMQALLRRVRILPTDPEALRKLIIRTGERDPAFAAEVAAALAAVSGAVTELAALPPALFVDRDAVRAQLAQPEVHLIAGVHGVGKTALVLQVARDAAGGFAGGQAYVNLDDHRVGESLQVSEVQAAVLRQFDIAVADEPPAAQAEQYWRALAHRRCVLILDNAIGVAELSALVQPWPASLVLVTVRRLTEDLRSWAPTSPVILHGLDEAGAWSLLEHRSPGMLAAEPAAAHELLALCDRFPFAILQVGVRLARRRGEPGAVAAVRDELAGSGAPDGLIRTCLSRTLAELPASTVTDLIVLAAQPVEDLSQSAAEAALGHRADELVDAGLVGTDGRGRLRLPRLVRDYVARAHADGDVDVDAPFDRLLRFYRDQAVAADFAIDSERLRVYETPAGLAWASAQVRPLDWLETEASAIAAVARRAYHRGRFVEVTQLCGALEQLLTSRGHHWLIAGVNEWGIRAASALNDLALEARIWAIQVRIFTQLQLFDRAAAALATAERLVAGVEHPRLHSSILEFRGRLAEAGGDLDGAIRSFERCLGIDGAHGLRRPSGLHHRMLANVLVKRGRPADALRLIDRASAATTDARNLARLNMVAAHAYLAIGDLGRALAAVTAARRLVTQAGATQYETELADLEATLAWRGGDIPAARARWGWIAQTYWNAGDPRFDIYLDKLNLLPPSPG